jgi:plasmid replication initiation protein
MSTPDHNAVVAKNNELIGQMAKFELSELRLIAYCLAHYDSRQPDNRSFKARVADLTSIFPMEVKSAYGVIRQTMLSLGKKPLEFQEGSKRHYWNWFSGFTYDEGNGEFEFKITPEIQPYLLKLEGTFTKYRLRDVYQFKAASTWKMYEVLKQWVGTKKWSVELDQLRLLLGVAGKYPLWADFHKWIVEPSTKEINAVSDLSIKYEQEKRGRRIVGLVFFILQKKAGDEDVIQFDSTQDQLYKGILGCAISQKTAEKTLYKIIKADKVDRILERLPGMIARAKKKNTPIGKYVIGAINKELVQGSLFDDQAQPQTMIPAEHQESLDCWQAKRRAKEKCAVRERGVPGQRKKCKICLVKIPPDQFGI